MGASSAANTNQDAPDGDIIICVDESQSAVPIPASGQLFSERVMEALACIEAVVARHQEAPQPPFQREPTLWQTDRAHQNVALLGRRGAGKTSLLLSVLHLLGADEESQRFRERYAPRLGGQGDTEATKTTLKRLESLSLAVDAAAIVEPSLLEPGEHLVAHVFGELQRRAQRRVEASIPLSREDSRRAEEFLRAAQAVAEHLPVLVAPSRLAAAWRDDGTEGLQAEVARARSGFQLERALRTFIDAYLAVVRRQVLVLGLDDVDLAHEHGEQVLESLRRYLTSPRLVALVTGDPDLFSSVLRASFLRKTGGDAPRREELPERGTVSDLADDLVEQYLKKILPAQFRVHVPDVSSIRPDRVRVALTDPGDRVADLPTFEKHFAGVLRACLRIRDHQPDVPSNRDLVRYYHHLVPDDARHFVEVCGFRTDAAVDGVAAKGQVCRAGLDDILFDFAEVWELPLARFGLRPRSIVELARGETRRVGLVVLNHVLTRGPEDAVALRLDPRTDRRDLNVFLAFLRFALEGHLDRRSIPGVLTLGLEYFVPVYYLGDAGSSQERGELRAQLALHLMDSHRRLYGRLVPWLGRERVRPGVVALADRPGALDLRLDGHDPSRLAAWRQVVGDPHRHDSGSWLEEAVRAARRFLRQGQSARQPERSEHAAISGVGWATGRLPGVFGAPHCPEIFRGSERTGGAKDGGTSVTALPQEMVTTSYLFHELAGALPRVVHRTWSLSDGKRTYLSPWQGLAVAHRVVNRIALLYEDSSEGRPIDADRPGSRDIRRIWETARRALAEHLGAEGGASAAREGSIPRETGGRAPDAGASDLPPEWDELRTRLEAVRHPADFYPRFDRDDVLLWWPRPLNLWPPEPPDDSNGKPPQLAERLRHEFASDPEAGHADRYFADWRGGGPWKNGTPWAGEPVLIRSWNDLQSCRLRAWDSVLDRLALAVTEWVLLWAPHWFGERSRKDDRSLRTDKPRFDQIQETYRTLLDDLANEAEFAGIWSGAGDVVQRWVLTFLNAVLVSTLKPKQSNADQGGAQAGKKADEGADLRPQLLHSPQQRVPARAARREQGLNHPLYQNLTRLREDDTCWTWSETFLSLASFPLFAMFLSEGGPLAYDAAKAKTMTPDLSWIGRFGRLPLQSLPDMERERTDIWKKDAGKLRARFDRHAKKALGRSAPAAKHHYLLDLAGLSWCGLDLRTARPIARQFPPMRDIEERRDGLIALLNSLVADVPLTAEAAPHVAPLMLAVYRALMADAPAPTAAKEARTQDGTADVGRGAA